MRLVKITKINQYKIATFQWHLQFNWFSIWSNCFRFRSSRLEVFCKKSVLKNFAKFSGKHLSQILFFNEVAGLKPAILLKKRLTRDLSGDFCEIFENYRDTARVFLLENSSFLWSLFWVSQEEEEYNKKISDFHRIFLLKN